MTTLRCSVFIATSLDGFIARRDGSLDWLERVQQPDEDYGYAELFASIDTLVLGRNTYDTVLGFGEWPYADKRCIVVSNRAFEPRHSERRFAGDLRTLVAELEAEGAQRAYVDGGALIRGFLAAGLIDDITLSIVPVLLGSGIPLFGHGVPERALVLESSRAFATGLVQNCYRVAP